jgi:hypothetical protein
MAQDKESFIMYCDLIHTVEQLPDETAGKLFKHILEYVNDRSPIATDLIVSVCFEPIKQQLKRDLQKWVDTVDKKSSGGVIGNLKRWHKAIYKSYIKGEISLEEAVKLSQSKSLSHTDKTDTIPIGNVSDGVGVIAVNVNVNDNVINKKSIKKEIPEFSEFLTYAKTLPPYKFELDFALEAKYNSWVENKWKDGHGAPIKNWKTKLQNTITFLKPMYSDNKTEDTRPSIFKNEFKG